MRRAENCWGRREGGREGKKEGEREKIGKKGGGREGGREKELILWWRKNEGKKESKKERKKKKGKRKREQGRQIIMRNNLTICPFLSTPLPFPQPSLPLLSPLPPSSLSPPQRCRGT